MSALDFLHISLRSLHANPQLLEAGVSARLGSDQSHQSICAHGFRALQWEAQSSAPHQLSEYSQSTRHTEEDGVVVHLRHSIVLHTKSQQSAVSVAVPTLTKQMDDCSLPAAALRCGRPRWARGSWLYPVQGAHWVQSYKAGQPT